MSDDAPPPTWPPGREQEFLVGSLLISPAANEIDGSRIDAKTMDVLVALVESSPGVTSVRQLLDRVWPNVVVGDNVVHQAIAHLRKALGDDPRSPRYLQSIPKPGYRLIAKVSRMPAHSAPSTASSQGDGESQAAPSAHETAREPTALNAPAAQRAASFSLPNTAPLLAVLAFDNLWRSRTRVLL